MKVSIITLRTETHRNNPGSTAEHGRSVCSKKLDIGAGVVAEWYSSSDFKLRIRDVFLKICEQTSAGRLRRNIP